MRLVPGGVFVAALSMAVLRGREARAMDCPCTWEEVICETDAVAEVEMILATKTTPDVMVVRREIWNRTGHPIRAYGQPNIPHATMTRQRILEILSQIRRSPDPGLFEEHVARFKRALERGSYRTIIFVHRLKNGRWSGGGLAVNGVEWLDHPKHGAWWAKVQPFLRQWQEAAKRKETPAFCSHVAVPESQLVF